MHLLISPLCKQLFYLRWCSKTSFSTLRFYWSGPWHMPYFQLFFFSFVSVSCRSRILILSWCFISWCPMLHSLFTAASGPGQAGLGFNGGEQINRWLVFRVNFLFDFVTKVMMQRELGWQSQADTLVAPVHAGICSFSGVCNPHTSSNCFQYMSGENDQVKCGPWVLSLK